MKILPISTKTGDKGTSGLANGERLSKDALIFEVLGTQDELNSHLGFALAAIPVKYQKQRQFLLEIQDTLFTLGAELARSPKVKLEESMLTRLEKQSDELQASMAEGWTIRFLYPGGCEAAARVDLARAVSRRFERLVVQLHTESPISELILQYTNRLSDYLFVLRCYLNDGEGYEELAFESENSYRRHFRQ